MHSLHLLPMVREFKRKKTTLLLQTTKSCRGLLTISLGAWGGVPAPRPQSINGKGTVNAKKKKAQRSATILWIWSRSRERNWKTSTETTRDREQTEETIMDFLVTCLVWCSCNHGRSTSILVSFTGMVTVDGQNKKKLQWKIKHRLSYRRCLYSVQGMARWWKTIYSIHSEISQRP